MKISAKDMSGTFLIILWYESEDEKLSLETFKSNWHEIIHTSLFSCQHMLNENIQNKDQRILSNIQHAGRADHVSILNENIQSKYWRESNIGESQHFGESHIKTDLYTQY